MQTTNGDGWGSFIPATEVRSGIAITMGESMHKRLYPARLWIVSIERQQKCHPIVITSVRL